MQALPPSSPLPLDVGGLAEWLVERGLQNLPLAQQFDGFCRRVVDGGFPAIRCNMSIGTLHPQHGARSYIWRPGRLVTEDYPRTPSGQESEAYLNSPIYRLRSTGEQKLRRRLDSNAVAAEFPLLGELRDAGMTDYVAWLVPFAPTTHEGKATLASEGARANSQLQGVFVSCATDVPTGFDDTHLAQIADLLPYLALAVKARSTVDTAQTLLATYLGDDAGRRVLTGELDRHALQRIDAVIWLCDLRGFSAVAGRVSAGELVGILNAYLEAMARPVLDHGGQILKFLGDGLLATFDLSRSDPQAVCTRALDAAAKLQDIFPTFNAERRKVGQRILDFGVALHLGEVLYGNVGTSERLDFTVVGAAVNEASRIEGMCRTLRRRVLVSSRFHEAAAAGRGRLISLGFHALRGIGEPQELFTLA